MLHALDLRKVPELVSETYTHACRQAAEDIQKYETVMSETIRPEVPLSKEKLRAAQKVIKDNLSHAERDISDGCNGIEMISNWLSILKSQAVFMDEVDKSEKSQIGQFMLSFTNTSQKLKNLETDLPEFLRNLIENEETPETIRLAQLWSKMELEYHNRCGIMNDVENQVQIARQRLHKVTVENEALTAENQHYDEQLETFSNSESYQMIQNARRHDLLLEEWAKKREAILEETDKVEEELKGYLDKENGEAVITKKAAQCDLEYEKLSAKYVEMMREVGEEAGISARNDEAILRSLEQELTSARSQQLAKESALTRNEIRKAKIAGERRVQRHRAEATAEISSLRQNLKKKMDVRSRRTKRGKAAQEPPVDAEKILLERCSECVEKGHQATMGRIKGVFDQEVEELKQILEAYLGCGTVSIEREVESIKRDHAKAVDVAQANMARLGQRSAERNLELAGVNAKVVTMEGLVDDYLKQWKQLDDEHTRLMLMSMDASTESAEAEKIRRETEVMDRFVEKATYIIDVLKKKLAFRVRSDTFNYLHRGLKRSKSQSDVDPKRTVDLSVRVRVPDVHEEEEKDEPEPVRIAEPSIEEDTPEESIDEEEEREVVTPHPVEEPVEQPVEERVEELVEEPPKVVTEPEPVEPVEVKSRDVPIDLEPMRRFRVALGYSEEPPPVQAPKRVRTARGPRYASTTHNPRHRGGGRRISTRYAPQTPPLDRKAATVQLWGGSPYHESILFAVTPFGHGELEDEVYFVDKKLKLSQPTSVTNTPGVKRRFIMKTPDAEDDPWANTTLDELSMKRNMADWRPVTRVRRSAPSVRKKPQKKSSFRTQRTGMSEFDSEIEKLVNMPLYSSRRLPRI